MKKPTKLIAMSALLLLTACADYWEVEPYDYKHGDDARYSTKKEARDRAMDGMLIRRKVDLPEE